MEEVGSAVMKFHKTSKCQRFQGREGGFSWVFYMVTYTEEGDGDDDDDDDGDDCQKHNL